MKHSSRNRTPTRKQTTRQSGSPPKQSSRRRSDVQQKQTKRTTSTPRAKGPQQSHTVAIRPDAGELRLNRFLAEAGVASRRKADELITSGVVAVNGNTVRVLGTRVNPQTDVVTVKGRAVTIDSQLVYILLNKPKDYITTNSDERGRHTVMELVPSQHRLYPVGRLDRNTTGALLLTNDGDLTHKLMHPRFHVRKSYLVRLGKKLMSKDLLALKKGVRLEDGVATPEDVTVFDPPTNLNIGIILTEGRNRQVRRMFEALGYDVKKLDRVEYAGLTTDNLRRGQWRYLDEGEVKRLRKLTGSIPG